MVMLQKEEEGENLQKRKEEIFNEIKKIKARKKDNK
jgi:hypothetical protein